MLRAKWHCRAASGAVMLRSEITAERLHARQAECLPGRFVRVVTRIEEGRLDAELALLPWMLAPNGYLHAASIVLLADTSAGYACMAHLPDAAKSFTTVELKTNFLGTVREGSIRTECRADPLGRTTQVWSATVFGSGDRKLGLFRCTQLILW